MKVEISAVQTIYNYKPEQAERIKDDLTLPNPAYANALRYSPYSRIAIPRYLTYYSEGDGVLEVPRGYKIPFPHLITKDERFTLGNVEYPPFLFKLRGTQQEAVDAYIADRGRHNGIIVVPTGGGKSIIGIYLAWKLKQKLLVIVHKDDLISGWKSDIMNSLFLRPCQIGMIKAKRFRIGKQITLTTIQTLSKLPPEKLKELRETFSMIIVDEGHHTPAKTYETSSTFPAYDMLTLTATDIRNDGLRKVMNFHFGDVVYRYQESEDYEDIIPAKNVLIKVINVPDVKFNPPDRFIDCHTHREVTRYRIDRYEFDLATADSEDIQWLIDNELIKRKPMDYHAAKKAISESEKYNNIVAKYVKDEYAFKSSCLVFCSEKEHCRELYKLLIDHGIPKSKVQLYYGDSTESKDTIKRKAESREALITIATYAIATEGTNVKSWERIFLADTVGNEKDLIQAVGRGRRTKDGKDKLIIYDFRTPNVKGIRGHGTKRDDVYRKMNFKYISEGSTLQPTTGFRKGFSYLGQR
jgi:superfamily II DNA or RNA helicase